MNGGMPVLPIYIFMVWTGTTILKSRRMRFRLGDGGGEEYMSRIEEIKNTLRVQVATRAKKIPL
jgi:hypothetical protein